MQIWSVQYHQQIGELRVSVCLCECVRGKRSSILQLKPLIFSVFILTHCECQRASWGQACQSSIECVCMCMSEYWGEKIRERGACVHAGEDLCLCICESVYVSETWWVLWCVCVRETEWERARGVCCELPEDLSEQWCVTERMRERFGAQRGREWAIEPQSEIIFFKKGRERGKDLEPSEKVKEKLIEKQKKGKERVMPREKRERGRLRLTDNAVICVWLGWIYWIRQALNSSLSFCLSVSLSLILSLSQSYVLRLITFLEYVSCYPEIITSEGEDILGWFTLS